MGKNVDKNSNAEMGINVTVENIDSCENSATMGKNVINTNTKMFSTEIASSVMGANPDSILTVKDVMGKNIDNNGNAEMGINIMEENMDSCENNAAMGKNVINTESNVSTVTMNTTVDTEKTVCQLNNVMCSDALTSPIDPYLDA